MDTHVLLWYLYDGDKLSESVLNILENEKNVYISIVSIWEIYIKYGLGKLDLKILTPTELFKMCEKFDFKILPISANEVALFWQLSVQYHKDPIDRLLIWQSIQNNYTLISNDKNINPYVSEGLQLAW